MGSNQTERLDKCTQLLENTRAQTSRPSNGLVFFGDFGAGKSHALQTLAETARQRGFIVSEGAISRNLQLADAKQLLSLLLNQTTSSSHPEDAFPLAVADFLQADHSHGRFAQWAATEHSKGRLSEHFKLIAENLGRVSYGSPEFELLMDFFHGIGAAPQVRQITGRRPTGSLPGTTRPWQTVRFLSRLLVEAGHAGWLVLLDELELIRLVGVSPTIGRAKSYVALGNWMGQGDLGTTNGLAVIGCMTTGYAEQQILPGPESANELSVIPQKLLWSASPELAPLAEKALKFIVDNSRSKEHRLVRPSDPFLRELQYRLKESYERAFGCRVSEKLIANTEFEPIRVQIRRWIVQWDLERHHIDTNLSVQALHQNLTGDDDSDDVDS
jgi:hypothetical protein